MQNTFSALGDPVRFSLVERLLSQGELSAGDLSRGETISAPAISRHLKILRQAGLIHQRVEKQHRYYTVKPQAIQAIHKWTIDYEMFWKSSLDRLEQALDIHETKQTEDNYERT